MFMGEYQHTIDAKGRLIIPAKLREEIGADCVLTRGADNCLTLYTSEDFDKLAQKVNTLKTKAKHLSKIRRFLFGSAIKLEFDKQGRILVPDVLRNYANLTKKTTIVGVNDRVEIWNSDTWEEFSDISPEEINEIANSMDLENIF